MALEQTLPNKPNFRKVVLLAAAAILVVFLLVFAFIRLAGRKAVPKAGDHGSPSTRLVRPGTALPPLG